MPQRERMGATKKKKLEAAKMLKTSQSRLAEMEPAEKTVSIDLLVRANLALGATPRELKHKHAF